MLRCMTVLAVWACALSMRAELVWEKSVITLVAPPEATKTEVTFRFKNAGPQAIDIKSIATSCGCTTADLPKKHYEPGESGEVRITFEHGLRTGPQEKTIMLTAEPSQPTSVLTLQVNVPERLQVSPQIVIWHPGDPVSSKIVTLRVREGDSLRPSSIKCDDSHFKTELRKSKSDLQLYELEITPLSTDKPEEAFISIVAEWPGHEAKTFPLYAAIK